MNLDDVRLVLSEIQVSELLYTRLKWEVWNGVSGHRENDRNPEGGWFIQLSYWEPDAEAMTYEAMLQVGREWWIPRTADADYVVRTAYKALMASLEHRLGEHFTYRGQRVYSPHRSLS